MLGVWEKGRFEPGSCWCVVVTERRTIVTLPPGEPRVKLRRLRARIASRRETVLLGAADEDHFPAPQAYEAS